MRAAAAPTPAVASPLPPPPPVPLPGRVAPRGTQRGMAAVPPPFPSSSSARAVPAPPPPRRSAQLPVPTQAEFDEPTPPPPVEQAYAPQAYAEQAPPAYGAVAHAPTLLGLGGGGLPVGRPQPTYQYQAEPAAPAAPLPRFQPQMMDFSGSATLPEKSSGPPRWLAVAAIVASLAGGAVLAHRATEGQMAAIAAFDEPRPAPARPTTLDEKSLPPRAPAAEPSKEPAEPAPAAEALPPAEPTAAPAAPARAHAAKPTHARAGAKRHAQVHRKPGRH